MSFYEIFLATIVEAETGDDPSVWDEVPEARLDAIAEQLHRIADALERQAAAMEPNVQPGEFRLNPLQ